MSLIINIGIKYNKLLVTNMVSYHYLMIFSYNIFILGILLVLCYNYIMSNDSIKSSTIDTFIGNMDLKNRKEKIFVNLNLLHQKMEELNLH